MSGSNWRLSIENFYQSIMNPVYERTSDNNDWYFVDGDNPYTEGMSNLKFSLKHPILTPAILFMANLFAQAKFKVINKETGDEIKNHPLLKLLNDPNYFQTRIDFLEQLQFLKVAQGRVAIYMRKGVGTSDIDSMYALRSDLITYPDDFETKFSFKSKRSTIDNQHIIYDEGGDDEMTIKMRDLVWLYDLPAVADKSNFTKNNSRLDGLQQTLINTNDSLVAKNIILKSNGKEMLSGGAKDSFPFDKKEQDQAKTLWNSTLGLGFGRSRVYMTRSGARWKSLHIALRDLGLDESVKVDGNLIYTALHIPPDVLSLEAKKTTYANFKESITSYIQNDIQSQLNDFTESLNPLLGDDSIELVGTYSHLPVMQFLEKQRYEAVKIRMEALQSARVSGLSDELALDLVGLPKNTKLNPLVITQTSNEETSDDEPEDTGASNESNPEENR